MNMMNLIRNKAIGAYFGVAVFFLSAASLVVYLIYANSIQGLMMEWVIVFLALAMVGEIVLFFFDNDYLPIIIAMFPMIAFGLFLKYPKETLGSVVDYFQRIVMFGYPENFSIIVVIVILLVVTTIVAVVSCFFARVKKVASTNS